MLCQELTDDLERAHTQCAAAVAAKEKKLVVKYAEYDEMMLKKDREIETLRLQLLDMYKVKRAISRLAHTYGLITIILSSQVNTTTPYRRSMQRSLLLTWEETIETKCHWGMTRGAACLLEGACSLFESCCFIIILYTSMTTKQSSGVSLPNVLHHSLLSLSLTISSQLLG